jgi:hypothetical protein
VWIVVKQQVSTLDATPSKRLFLSIIADYDVNRSICELVDNAFDIWTRNRKDSVLSIAISLDKDQQVIQISDNAGGVEKSELGSLVAPGQTAKRPEEEIIGIFGVGTKRAVVALAQDVRITTRYAGGKTYRLEFDDSWLESEDWKLPCYEVDDVAEGTTLIELQRLRSKLDQESISALKKHIAATYAVFLRSKNARITINKERITGLRFDNWAYPPKHCPRRYVGSVTTEDGNKIRVNITAGLSRSSSPATGEYGVYIYCNKRLVARALKTYDVGFAKGLAGLPHPNVSLVKVIVALNGPARWMPWNSSKSGIASNHKVFLAIRSLLVQLVKHYASLSRALQGRWPGSVFRFKTGEMVESKVSDFPALKDPHLPPLPRSKPRYGDVVRQANLKISRTKPWTVGLYESMIAVDLISKQDLEQKNRICLILLDSALEIAFKEFLVNESGEKYSDRRLLALFENRETVQNEVRKFKTMTEETWKKIGHYYRLRSKLVHERVSVSISDNELKDYRDIVQSVMTELFGGLAF